MKRPSDAWVILFSDTTDLGAEVRAYRCLWPEGMTCLEAAEKFRSQRAAERLARRLTDRPGHLFFFLAQLHGPGYQPIGRGPTPNYRP